MQRSLILAEANPRLQLHSRPSRNDRCRPLVSLCLFFYSPGLSFSLEARPVEVVPVQRSDPVEIVHPAILQLWGDVVRHDWELEAASLPCADGVAGAKQRTLWEAVW